MKNNYQINLAFLDDEQSAISTFKQILYDYNLKNNDIFDVTSFQDEDLFLNKLSLNHYDCVIIDVYLKKTNGIELAKKIENQSFTPIIVMISSDDNNGYNAYFAHPYFYIRKSQSSDYYHALNALKEYFLQRHQNDFDHVLISASAKNYNINYYKLIEITSLGKIQILTFADGTSLEVVSSLEEILHQLSHKIFVQINKGVAINVLYVTRVSFRKITVEYSSKKEEKMVSRHFYQNFTAKFNAHYRSEDLNLKLINN